MKSAPLEVSDSAFHESGYIVACIVGDFEAESNAAAAARHTTSPDEMQLKKRSTLSQPRAQAC